ncbi:hypothetical protein A8C56_09960 [Niabella ginsenosidivorans]|uniref:DUF1330 domain-containing protein n=1 Tax=Niabella ginsenosidivorans TaxID=1176587 RepID=A0A1A9I0W4_9BACT|nr:hypothetical protein [Niabella ginsenosidivorans]ANH81266.1 hypothetical protein A8C56_09960 [Niabella ginsenosidivorans]
MIKAYLEITLQVEEANRAGAAGIYNKYKTPFLETISGAVSKELLLHVEDVQVLHGFNSVESAQEYLMSDLFNNGVVTALKPYLKGHPDIKIYHVA